MNYIEEREYSLHKKQIDNCVLNLQGADRASEVKRIIRELRYAKKHTAFTSMEFFMLDLSHRSHSEWLKYLPDSATHTISYRLNSYDQSFYTGDKYEVYLRFTKYFKRDLIRVVSDADKDILIPFIRAKMNVILKPIRGSLGDNIQAVDSSSLSDPDSFFKEVRKKYPDGCIAEELIKQERSLTLLNPTSVNTLRITTVRMNDRIDTEGFLRVGKMFSKVDNIAKGGIVCSLDQETGEITGAIDQFGSRFTIHPHTRTPLVGFSVPNYREAVTLAKELALLMPNCRYIGWDFALTDSGWVLVELNSNAGIYCIQQTLGRGIRSDFEQYFHELGLPDDFPGAFKRDFK